MKILIADDLPVNIAAAKEAAAKLAGEHTILYAASAEEAIRAINTAFEAGDFFDLVITDLKMEELESGLDVVETAFFCLTTSYVVTGQDPTTGSHGHGATTTVRPMNVAITGKKREVNVWDQIFQIVFSDHSQNHTRMALDRYRRFGKRITDQNSVEAYLSSFGRQKKHTCAYTENSRPFCAICGHMLGGF